MLKRDSLDYSLIPIPCSSFSPVPYPNQEE